MQTLKELATVRSYHELIAVLRTRADELDLTREAIEVGANLQPGYAAKLLAQVPIKGLGPLSLGPLLGILGLKLVVIEDREVLRSQFPKRKRVMKRAR